VKAERTVVVVPTYDERENLPVLERGLRAHLPGAHLMVVDDASPDGTGAVADAIAARRPGQVHVLHRPAKQGLGRAYVAGFRRALALGYDVIVQMDCDLSHDPAAVGSLLAALEAGADLALGSRYVPGGATVNWGLARRLVSRWGSFYARVVLGVPYRDLTGGFKAWRREALAAIPLGEVHAEGYAFQIEMTYRAHRLGRRIAEVPITFVDRRVGRSKVSGRIVLEAAILCWTMRGRG
jgi:dolichol-phosphate mannosyltransferase